MAASKSGFMKDALILFAITLVSGLCLGVVYDVTKAPIEAATIAANNATYKQVLPEAESFDDVEGSTEKIAETADEIAKEADFFCFGTNEALRSSPFSRQRTQAAK